MDITRVIEEIKVVVYECGTVMLEAKRDDSMISEKSGHANFVTTYDTMVQRILEEKLKQIVPEAQFMGEEEDEHADVSEGYAFIVDPIDGTTNFIRDYKSSCISVGLIKDGKPYAGVVYQPYLDEMYTAVLGMGAYLNGKRIHVSSHPLENAIVLFGTAPYYDGLREKTFALAYACACKALDIRRSGSAAIDLVNIACGRAELFFELTLQPWDFAAGAVIVTEAGGRITDIDGNELCVTKASSILATNGVAVLPDIESGNTQWKIT